MATSCTSCHGASPKRGAKLPLVTLEDFTKPDPQNPAQKVGDLVVVRMKDTVKPMPESGLLTADQIATVETWVKEGMPRGACGAIEAKPDPFWDQPPTCTGGMSNVTDETTRSQRPLMYPGESCNACHRKEREGDIFAFAGTVYPTPHEPDRCNGVNGTTAGARVVATDAAGKVLADVPVNAAGNFSYKARLTGSFFVKVVQNGKERAMKGAVSSALAGGDCNACHTQDGASVEGSASAPGRIVLPQ
jgi:mono/diheme cytochrome c family protein